MVEESPDSAPVAESTPTADDQNTGSEPELVENETEQGQEMSFEEDDDAETGLQKPVVEESNTPSATKSKFNLGKRGIILCAVGLGVFAGLVYWIASNSRARRSASTMSMTSTSAPTMKPTPIPTAFPTMQPTQLPTSSPTEQPTALPTSNPTVQPTSFPTSNPTSLPTASPTEKPVTPLPTSNPTRKPVAPPSMAPIPPPEGVTYVPGKLTTLENKLLLSEGLQARIIAESGKRVTYSDGSSSKAKFHILPDAGATFPDTRNWNKGGWIYASNSEARNKTLLEGGVGAITFDKDGEVLDYKMVLDNTHMNCGGGRTPWGTWVSCEEIEFDGQIYQVDPTGERRAEKMTIGSPGGRWESFAYDIRDKSKPRFFATEDHNKGTTRRFTPSVTHWGGDEWQMLHEDGVTEYLFINPNRERTGGTFEWSTNLNAAKNNARSFYPQSEGIDIKDGKMYIVCKKIKQLFVFDLDEFTYHNVTTKTGLFDGGPDQMQRIIGGEGGLLYFTEEGGKDAGIHARDEFGRFFTVLESPELSDETTGLSISPDKKHMYVAYQNNGILFDVTRKDGKTFDAQTLDVKYHSTASSRRLNSQWIRN